MCGLICGIVQMKTNKARRDTSQMGKSMNDSDKDDLTYKIYKANKHYNLRWSQL